MTQHWIEVDPITGRIPRRYLCNQEPEPQQKGNIVLPMKADRGQKLEHDGLDDKGRPINPRLMRDEQAEKPRKVVSAEDELILVRQADWDSLLARVGALEKKNGS